MKIKLLKVTRDFINPNLYFADFEFEDIGMVIKAVRYNSEKKCVYLPYSITTAGRMFALVSFPESQRHKEVLSTMKEIIESSPLPEKTEDYDERARLRALSREEKRKRKIEFLEKMGRASTEFKKNQCASSAFPKHCKKEIVPRVWVRPHTKENGKVPISGSVGNGFTQIPVPKRGY